MPSLKDKIKYRFLEWKYDRILKKSGFSSWEHYLRANDPDFYFPGRTVKDKLFGYPYIAKADYKKLPVRYDALWGPITHWEHLIEWCNQYCKGKYRTHYDRVIVDHAGQYVPNEIGGYDELFVGFKDERDYTLFVLKWL